MSFLYSFFDNICRLINNLKTFNEHMLMLVSTFIDRLVYKLSTDQKGLMRWLVWAKLQRVLFR